MTTYVALWRAVNVGSRSRLRSSELVRVATALGFEGARSWLQSGNLVLRAPTASEASVASRLEQACSSQLGLSTQVIVRSSAEWSRRVRENPYAAEAARDPAHLVLVALSSAPGPAAWTRLRALVTGREYLEGRGRDAYLVYPDGIGRSRLTLGLLERTVGATGTARNWNTVLALDRLAGGVARG